MTKRDPLLTSDTRDAELFTMKTFLERVNEGAAKAAIENDAKGKRDVINRHLNDTFVRLHAGEANLTIGRVETSYSSITIIYSNGYYSRFEADDCGELYQNSATVEEGIKAGLVPDDILKPWKDAETKWRELREDIAGKEQLRQAVLLLGKDKVQEIISADQ